MLRFHRRWLLALVLVLALPTVHAAGISLQGRIGIAGSNYDLTEGKSEYSETSTWTLGFVRGELPLGSSLRALGEYQFGQTSKVDVTKGTPAANQRGRLNQIMAGGEFLWSPMSFFNLGVGVGYLSETQTHTWQAEHPNPDRSPIFSAAEVLDWTWTRTTSGLLLTAAVDLDAGSVQLTGRVGLAPNLTWKESTRAAKESRWEQWSPAAMKGSGGTYELEGNLRLTPTLSLVAGIDGIVQQSPKIAALSETYDNSDDYGEERTVVDIPAAFDHRYAGYVGLKLQF